MQREEIKQKKQIEKINKKLASLEKKLKEIREAYEISLNKIGCQEFSTALENYIDIIKLKIEKQQNTKNDLLNKLSNIEYEKIL